MRKGAVQARGGTEEEEKRRVDTGEAVLHAGPYKLRLFFQPPIWRNITVSMPLFLNYLVQHNFHFFKQFDGLDRLSCVESPGGVVDAQ